MRTWPVGRQNYNKGMFQLSVVLLILRESAGQLLTRVFNGKTTPAGVVRLGFVVVHNVKVQAALTALFNVRTGCLGLLIRTILHPQNLALLGLLMPSGLPAATQARSLESMTGAASQTRVHGPMPTPLFAQTAVWSTVGSSTLSPSDRAHPEDSLGPAPAPWDLHLLARTTATRLRLGISARTAIESFGNRRAIRRLRVCHRRCGRGLCHRSHVHWAYVPLAESQCHHSRWVRNYIPWRQPHGNSIQHR